MAEPQQHHDFAPHVGALFRFAGSHLALRLAAIEVHDRHPVPGAARTAFTLVFHGPAGDVLAEGFRAAQAEDGTAFAFYIQPIHTPSHDRQDYQVVFN